MSKSASVPVFLVKWILCFYLTLKNLYVNLPGLNPGPYVIMKDRKDDFEDEIFNPQLWLNEHVFNAWDYYPVLLCCGSITVIQK